MAGDKFIHPDFLLQSSAARRLYHEQVAGLPIIDYHCHLDPALIAAGARWENLTRIWLDGDHYKWRAMRACGVAEELLTGDAPDRDKFDAWAATLPSLLRNPLYHWSHLELARYFGMDDLLLSADTADRVWERAGEQLGEADFTAPELIRRSRVQVICTTDDPTDSLAAHVEIAAAAPGFRVLPTWRPDRGMECADPEAFNAWVDRLAAAADLEVSSLDDYLAALRKRHDFFHQAGCRLSDHGLETFPAGGYTESQVERIFADLRARRRPGPEEVEAFRSAMLHHFAVMDAQRGWVQQFHYGCLRNNNSARFADLGPDRGFDSIGDTPVARNLGRFLDRLEREGRLAKTIVYNLNPADNAVLATMLGNFQGGGVAGRMQMGSGWWFMDQKDGMEKQLECLSQLGVLSRFVGMLTDSRSFLSFTRHEYFRRILCNLLGRDMEAGLVPMDYDLVGGLARDVAYNNARDFFDFELP